MMAEEITIGPGQIQFFDNYRPTLAAGTYTFRFDQEIDVGAASSQKFSAEQEFLVAATRWHLGPADVHAVYPPPNAANSFAHVLPHVVLRRRSLPWERTLGVTAPIDGETYLRPWLALLLFDETDLAGATPLVRPIDTVAGQTSTPQLIHPKIELDAADKARLRPQNADADDPRQTPLTQTIDVSAHLFASLLPRLDDLPFLAHVRQVDTGGKEILGMEADGWFSVVVSSRLPSAAETPQRYIAHLVSLEGWQDWLVQNRSGVSPAAQVRLVTLANWTFTSKSSTKGDFKILAERLLPPDNDETLTLLRPDARSLNGNDADDQKMKAALDAGYIPLNYVTRLDETSMGWYRGPLAPQRVPRQYRAPYPKAETALRFDQESGLFDVSHSTAFELGRLLALSDESFARALVGWRQRASYLHHLFGDRKLVGALLAGLQSGALGLDEAVSLLDTKQMTRLISRNVAHRLTTLVESRGTITDRAGGELAKLSGLTPALLEEMLLQPVSARGAWLETKLASTSNANGRVRQTVIDLANTAPQADGQQEQELRDPLDYLQRLQAGAKLLTDSDFQESLQYAQWQVPAEIANWLGRLLLGYGIPFAYLVPDPAMIPQDSLRFFYVDSNWLDALLDGAMSVGVHTERDQLLTQILAPVLRGAAERAAAAWREQARTGVTADSVTPRPPVPQPAEDGQETAEMKKTKEAAQTEARLRAKNIAPDPGWCGFWLRSELASGWPGLELEVLKKRPPAADDSDDTDPSHVPVEILRMERLAPDLMFCLLREKPDKIILREPAEDLHFGLSRKEENGEIVSTLRLRHKDGTLLRQEVDDEATVELDTSDMLSNLRIMNIDRMRQRIRDKIKEIGADMALGPANFALQLIDTANKLTIPPDPPDPAPQSEGSNDDS